MLDFNEPMKKLKGVKGYLGAALLNQGGETLYMDEEGTNTDIAYAASMFNDVFSEISETSMDIGFTPAQMLEARTEDDYVFLVQSVTGKNAEDKLTFFTILKGDGNVPLAKMVIKRSAVKVLAIINSI